MTHTISQDSTITLAAFEAELADTVYMGEPTASLMARTLAEWAQSVGIAVDELRIGPTAAWPIRPWPVYVRGHLIGEINPTHSSPCFTALPRNQRHADLLDLEGWMAERLS